MGSSRLPGKVLKKVCDKPLLQHQIERIQRSRLIDRVVIATTSLPADDAIAELGEELGVSVFRGSENDVLGRICRLIEAYKVDIHVELLGDSPLTDPQIVDEVIGFYLKHKNQYEYVSNGVELSYPSGMEVNVYSGKSLLDAESRVARDDILREHVDIHLSKSHMYSSYNLKAPAHFFRPDIFLEIDTLKDFEMVSSVIQHFNDKGIVQFSLSQILDFLGTRIDLIKLNQNEERRWWAFKELAKNV